MEVNENQQCGTARRRTDTLLFVADFVNVNQDVLDLACEIADKYNAHLQLLHVVDPDHASSSPDGQMGSQYSLEMLADRVRAMKRSAVSLLSFGRPERVIPRRAVDVNATVIVIPLNGSATDRLQKRLVRQLEAKCDCPVLAISPFARNGAKATASSMEKLFASTRKIFNEERLPQRDRIRSAEHMELHSSFTLASKAAYSLQP